MRTHTYFAIFYGDRDSRLKSKIAPLMDAPVNRYGQNHMFWPSNTKYNINHKGPSLPLYVPYKSPIGPCIEGQQANDQLFG